MERKNKKNPEPEFTGSDFKNVKVNCTEVTLGCLSEPARVLLETIIKEWSKEEKALKKIQGKKVPSYYQFAYWLVRWSGLIEPKKLKEGVKVFWYLDKSTYSKMDIKVVANTKKDAVATIWNFLKKSTDYNIEYFNKKDIANLTNEMVFTDPKIISNESDCSDLESMGYLKD